MEKSPSDRLIDQRIRNRIMEELSILARGQSELQEMGWEYLLCFLDWFPNAPELNPAVACMSDEERAAVAEVLKMVCRFADEAKQGANTEDLLRLQHAERIAPVAARTLALLNQRGRFNEDDEEDEPSGGLQPI